MLSRERVIELLNDIFLFDVIICIRTININVKKYSMM